jgi:hypothetical protein
MYDLFLSARAEAHQQELLRSARNERLSRLSRAGRTNGAHLACRALAWAGSQLQAAGAHLQHRYGVSTSPAPLHS